MEKTVVLNVEYTMKPGGALAFVQELTDTGILQQVRAWEGCLKYDYYRPLEGENLLLVEWWTDEAALTAHQTSDYFPKLLEIQNKYCIHSALEKYSVK